MKNLIGVSLFLLAFSNAFGQQTEKLRRDDSIKLVDTWKAFKGALENKDLKTLKTLSLNVVECDLFQTPDPNKNISPFIPLDTFIKQFSHDHKLRHVIATKKYHFMAENQRTFHPQFSKTKNGKSIRFFDVWFVVWKPNELAKGHEGASDAFQFVKIGHDFKFYGMTSIP